MVQSEPDRRKHWEDVYSAKAHDEVSWFQNRPEVSLSLIRELAPGRDAAILDVGGGASTLVDHLLKDGRENLFVLDFAASALKRAQARLGSKASNVQWISTDVTAWRPDISVDLWHDRAVLHFLTARADQEAYARALRAALKPDGAVIIAGFAPGGPVKCSGLKIVQHDTDSLQKLLGDDFTLVKTRDETHATPSGAEQAFRYHLFRREKAFGRNGALPR